MARGLGCVEYADGTRHYFVHCETAGGIYSALFGSPAEAQATYRQVGIGMSKLIRTDRQVEVVKFARMSGWDDDNTVEWKFERYGLATKDAFLEPLHDHYHYRCLQLVNGSVHVAQQIDGGFSGQYEVPLCDLGREGSFYDFNPEAKEFAYEDWFGKPLNLCPECADALIG